MILDSTLRKLQIVLTAAKTTLDMTILVDWVDLTTTATTAGLTPSLTNGVTLVDMLPAPAAATQRKVNGITIYNKDTAAKTLQVILNDNGTAYTIVDVTIQIDDTLGYTDTGGWYIQDLNGARKTAQGQSDAQLAALIHAATSKTPIVDADEIPISDSAASWGLKKLTWANLKTTLGSTFAALAGSASQTFSVAAATAAEHAVRVGQLGVSASTLPYYETQTSAGTYTSGAIAMPGVFVISKVGNVVTLSILPFTSGSAATNVANITFGDVIPAAFRPPTYEQWSSGAIVIVGGVLVWTGTVRVQANGIVTLYRDGSTTLGWGTAVNTGLQYGFSMSWSL